MGNARENGEKRGVDDRASYITTVTPRPAVLKRLFEPAAGTVQRGPYSVECTKYGVRSCRGYRATTVATGGSIDVRQKNNAAPLIAQRGRVS